MNEALISKVFLTCYLSSLFRRVALIPLKADTSELAPSNLVSPGSSTETIQHGTMLLLLFIYFKQKSSQSSCKNCKCHLSCVLTDVA